MSLFRMEIASVDNYTKEEQLKTLGATKWSKDHAALLSQARIFQNDESQRLKTTTLKVQIYLGILIAIPAATTTVLRLGHIILWMLVTSKNLLKQANLVQS